MRALISRKQVDCLDATAAAAQSRWFCSRTDAGITWIPPAARAPRAMQIGEVIKLRSGLRQRS